MKLLLLLPILFLGCASDGSFDAAGFTSAVSSVTSAYQQLDQEQPRIVGYDAMGNPIYR
jgi:hypothetical protein